MGCHGQAGIADVVHMPPPPPPPDGWEARSGSKIALVRTEGCSKDENENGRKIALPGEAPRAGTEERTAAGPGRETRGTPGDELPARLRPPRLLRDWTGGGRVTASRESGGSEGLDSVRVRCAVLGQIGPPWYPEITNMKQNKNGTSGSKTE